MASEKIAQITVEELKALIAEMVQQQLLAIKTSLLPEISDLIDSKLNREESVMSSPGGYILSELTETEQQKRYELVVEMFQRWDEQEDEEEQKETFEYLQKALDEDRLSNRPLFPKK